MYRKDWNKNGGGLLLYINEGIPGKLINSYEFKEGSEIIVFEFNISNKKWLLLGNYKPFSQNELCFINEIKLSLNFFSSSYKNYFFKEILTCPLKNLISKTYLTAFI